MRQPARLSAKPIRQSKVVAKETGKKKADGQRQDSLGWSEAHTWETTIITRPKR